VSSELPSSDGWVFSVDGFDDQEQRVHNALFTLAGAGVGTSGGSLLTTSTTRRWVVVDGVYDGRGPETELLTGPVLHGLAVDIPSRRLRRELDLRTGVMREILDTDEGPVAMTRFVSAVRPGIVVVRTRFADGITRGAADLAPSEHPLLDAGRSGGAVWARVAASEGGIAIAMVEQHTERIVDNVAAIVGDAHDLPDADDACARAVDAAETGFDQLRAEHARAWSERWDDADIVIEGDPELQLATRFSLFQLMASVRDTGEAAVGARGLSGTGYRGHVFWDADTFVLPFLAATHPASARAMLEYRIQRLPAARAAARARNCNGARFPWESAGSGEDVTPTSARDRSGRVLPIRTGQLEEHIVAEIAWAANEYAAWTGDDEFRRAAGATLLVETARYWASRARFVGDQAHIFGVIGPDEYHEPVDDNAFTNVMARWNLRAAADAVTDAYDGCGVTDEEVARWRHVADALVDGHDTDTGIYEQFAGFYGLEPLLIADVAPRRPIAADMLLGAERVHRSQVIKQADVLMLCHLVPDEVEQGSLDANLGYYEPRTAHGSSLSPAIHAALYARAGDLDRALAALHIASRIDLDDLTGTTAAGLHLATMGGLWQALVYGFAGVRPRHGRLIVDPQVPVSWPRFEVHVRYRSARVVIRMGRYSFTVEADQPIPLTVSGIDCMAGPGALSFERRGDHWECDSP
jgi:trehalose/maltose hydrolase-like predicted phosphorylase